MYSFVQEIHLFKKCEGVLSINLASVKSFTGWACLRKNLLFNPVNSVHVWVSGGRVTNKFGDKKSLVLYQFLRYKKHVSKRQQWRERVTRNCLYNFSHFQLCIVRTICAFAVLVWHQESASKGRQSMTDEFLLLRFAVYSRVQFLLIEEKKLISGTKDY